MLKISGLIGRDKKKVRSDKTRERSKRTEADIRESEDSVWEKMAQG
jgi:hypothetical protein